MVLLGLVFAASACGSEIPAQGADDVALPSSSISTTGQVTPPTTVAADASTSTSQPFVEAVVEIDTSICPNFVKAVETGEIGEITDGGPITTAQDRLYNDIVAARDYAAAYPNDFASIRYENAPHVRIVIAFTQNVEAHCVSLRRLLEYSDEFQIIQGRFTESELLAIASEIHRDYGEMVAASGLSADVEQVMVGVNGPGAIETADELIARYGDRILVVIGMFRYPPQQGDPDRHVLARGTGR